MTQKRSKKKIQRKGLIKADQRLPGEESLSYEQAKYVAYRSICETDQEAIEKVGRSVQTLWNWRQKPVFVEIEQHYRHAPLMAAYMLLAAQVPDAVSALGDTVRESTDFRAKTTAAKAILEEMFKLVDKYTPSRREIVIVPSEVWEKQIESARSDYKLSGDISPSRNTEDSR